MHARSHFVAKRDHHRNAFCVCSTVVMTFLTLLLRDPDQAWQLENLDTGTVLAARVQGAFESAARRRGLLGRNELVDEALVIAPCNAVHTFFMRFPIDILFVDRTGTIVRMSRNVRPWRIAAGWRAFATIELPAGVIDRSDTRRGHRLA